MEDMNNKKLNIGILAFSSCTNYGGMLQVYALQEMIRRMGHNPQVVNLWPIPNNKYLLGVLHNPNVGIGTRIKGLRSWCTHRSYRLYEQRYRAFQCWQKKHLHMTKQCWKNAKEFAENPPACDLLEVGSDQVFNDDVSRLFLCTDVPTSLPRVSYGASFGGLDKHASERARLKEGLSKFIGLSAREKSGTMLIRDILGMEIPWVVDPVLLPGRDFWQAIATEDDKEEDDGYAVVYWLGRIDLIRTRIERLHSQLGIPIRLFVGNYDKTMPVGIKGVDIQWGADPFDFVRSIAHAKYVVSNSFHAMMFSIIFSRRAYFATDEGGPARGASASRFTEIAKVAGCDKSLYSTWPDDKIDFFDMSQSLDACAEMIGASQNVLKSFCDKVTKRGIAE